MNFKYILQQLSWITNRKPVGVNIAINNSTYHYNLLICWDMSDWSTDNVGNYGVDWKWTSSEGNLNSGIWFRYPEDAIAFKLKFNVG